MSEVLQLAKMLSQYIEFIIVTMGSKGVVTIRKSSGQLEARLYPVQTLTKIHNVSGAGDCFASGFIHGVLSGLDQNSCINIGFQAAKSALLSDNTVPKNLQFKYINEVNYTVLDMSKL